ncbi:MAG TPA: TMEM175 family protein [Chitinophagaceae bacterium]|nr:TMEM175 family protein [Chitinophagaceae bacterium]
MGILTALSETVAYHKQRSHRIETLADGVFAIVMTLLVLDIHVPIKEINSENDVYSSLLHAIPRILTFILSFSVAGQSWSIFTNHFNYIHTTDRNENIITLLYLMFVSLLPFSTSFLSVHLWSRVAMGFYIINILLMFSFSTLHWLYAYRMGFVKAEGDSSVVIHKAIMRRVRAKYIAYALVVICCFFSSYLALAGTILIHIIFTFSGFIELLVSASGKKIKTATHI